jgi:hypothetical protein
MPFKSKAEMRKWGELVKQGKISQKTFQEALRSTPDVHGLPERVGQPSIKSTEDLRRAALNMTPSKRFIGGKI